MIETKICTKCKTEKEVSDYYKSSKYPNQHRAICKKCMNDSSLKHKIENKELLRGKRKVNYDKELNRIKCAQYREKNREKLRSKYKEWRIKHKDKRNQRNQTPKYKLMNAMRSRLTYGLKGKYEKKYNTMVLVGCDIDFLRNYLEERFTDGMSWENYGFYGWHVDHIIPLSSAKTEEEIHKLYHYTNLQPLWGTTKEINGVIYEGNLNKNGRI